MAKVVIYARYSSSSQREASIDQQIKVCADYCDRNGYEITHIYADKALTGKTDKRPQFQNMIFDSEKKEFQYVVVYALDRFSRNRYDSAVYKKILNDNGVKVLSATESISDAPSGIVMEAILEAMAEQYSAELSMKIRRGYADNASKHLAFGSVPFGFRRSQDGHYVVCEPEAEIVREIFQRIANKEKYVDIFNDLNNRGILTRKGAKWSKSSFNSLITNERYIGTYIYKDQKDEDAIPQIVDKNLFWKVQDQIKRKKGDAEVRGRRTKDTDYILTGKLYCSCGEHLLGVSGTSRTGEKKYYYQCNGKKNKTCESNYVKKDFIERAVAEAIRDLCMDDECIRWMAHDTIELQKKRANVDRIPVIKDELAQIDKELDNCVKAIRKGIITDSIQDSIKELEDRKHTLKWQMADIEQAQATMMTEDKIIAFMSMYKYLDMDNIILQRGLIDAFVDKVTINGQELTIDFTIKKEDHQVNIKLDGQDEDGLVSTSPRKWRCGSLSRIKDWSFRYITWVVYD